MPEMLACLTNAAAGGKTRFSCSTVSILDDIAPPQDRGDRMLQLHPRVQAIRVQTTQDGIEIPRNERGTRPAAAARLHLRQPLAAAAALPRPDRRPGDLCLAVLAGAFLPADGHVR